jgi:hypothetical protein
MQGANSQMSAYGAKLPKGTSVKAKTARKELLAGLLWIHANSDDAASALPRAPIALQLLLAEALELDRTLQAAASWPIAVARRVLARMTPGSTPTKRKPQDDGAFQVGQIVKPGLPVADGGDGTGGIAAPQTKKEKAARTLLAPTDLVTSCSDSGVTARGTPGAAGVTKPAARRQTQVKIGAIMMPASIEAGDSSTALVKAQCCRAWRLTAEMELHIPARHWLHLFKAESWTGNLRTQYDKMIARQSQDGGFASRREDLTNILFIHRARLVLSGDAGLALLGKNLAAASAGELLSDFTGAEGGRLGGPYSRADLKMIFEELQRHDPSLG